MTNKKKSTKNIIFLLLIFTSFLLKVNTQVFFIQKLFKSILFNKNLYRILLEQIKCFEKK